ncbi:MAG: hypothetical protein AAF968_22910 [Pseudomonadota bacterium]
MKRITRLAASKKTLDRLQPWRRVNPDLAFRSAFPTGCPRETEAEFEVLPERRAEARLDRVGCFAYEDVPGAASNSLPDHVCEEVSTTAAPASWSSPLGSAPKSRPRTRVAARRS